MRYLILSALTPALLSIALPSQAMPLGAGPASFNTGITHIRDDCGPFGHRSHYGYCKDNLHPELTYQPGEYRHDDYDGYRHGGGYRFGGGPRFYDGGGYYERRCFIRETYDGPVRICR